MKALTLFALKNVHTDFFQTLYCDRQHGTPQFDTSVNDHDLHSSSHFLETAKFVLLISGKFYVLDEI